MDYDLNIPEQLEQLLDTIEAKAVRTRRWRKDSHADIQDAQDRALASMIVHHTANEILKPSTDPDEVLEVLEANPT